MPQAGSRKTVTTSDGRELRLTSLDKIMYPETGFTKADVIDYYTAVAEPLLRQLRDRVVTRIRYPDGIGGERFFQKNIDRNTPGWIRRFLISASPGTGKEAKQVRYPVIDDESGLLWMANQAALELHTPQWHVGPRGGVRKPDRLVIDLDPGEGVGLDACARVAHLVAARLAEDDLHLFPVTSGGKGLHLYAPAGGRQTAHRLHAYVQRIARELADRYPDEIVAVIGKAERAGKVMIDWSQNHPARSTATPYTLRGKPAPTVAAPRSWEEIGPGLRQLGPDEVVARLKADGDPLTSAGLG
ncbi:MAG: non-homologous end-joining DNA ligase [Thermomicrobiales bacterium]